jgi:hypothetical protein
MIKKYASEQARSEHAKGAALAALRSVLDGKLRAGLVAQILERGTSGRRCEPVFEDRVEDETGVVVALLGALGELAGGGEQLPDRGHGVVRNSAKDRLCFMSQGNSWATRIR